MKVIQYDQYGGPDVLQYRERKIPKPSSHEALISVKCASVIPGDWKVRSGHLQEMFPIEFPNIPGRDGSGIIVSTGEKCNWAKKGDEVCFLTKHTEQGSYAEFLTRPEEMVIAKPSNVNFAEGAAMMHAGTCAWIALVETAQLKGGEKVLIHGGAGAIGGMATQIAKYLNCEVTVTCSEQNIEYCKNLGAAYGIPYTKRAAIEKLPPQDIVLDLQGGEVHETSCRVLRPGGTLVWLIANPFTDISKRYGVLCQQAVIHDRREPLEQIAELVKKGNLRPQVSQRLSLRSAIAAHETMERGKNSRGRIILDINKQDNEK